MSPFLHPPVDIRQPVVIISDGGGLVDDYMKAAWQYRLEKRRVEIRGSCRSACILALSVPNVCVAPGALVKAHHAYEVDTHTPRTDITDKMLAQLPVKIRTKLDGNITVNYNPNATLTYTQLVALGVPSCDGPTVVAASQPAQLPPKAIPRPAKIDIVTPIVNIAKLPLLPFAIAAKAINSIGAKK